MRKSLLSCAALLLFSILYFGCRKADVIEPRPEVLSGIFAAANSTAPAIRELAKVIQRQDEQFKFSDELLRRAGRPRWDGAIVIAPNGLMPEQNEPLEKLFYVPFVKDSAIEVNALLLTYVKGVDTIYKLIYKQHYTDYGFDSLKKKRGWSARELFLIFAKFNYKLFGHEEYIINDGRLFNKGKEQQITVKVGKPNDGKYAEGECKNCNSALVMDCDAVTYCEPYLQARLNNATPSTLKPGECETKVYCYTRWGGSSGGIGGGTADGTLTGAGTYNHTTNAWYNTNPCPPPPPATRAPSEPPPSGCGSGNGTAWTPIQNSTATIINQLSTQLTLTATQKNWLTSNPVRAYELNDFLNIRKYDALTNADRGSIAISHLSRMMTNADYLAMVNSFAANVGSMHPFMVDLFKELAVEIGLKVIKKYIPGYGDWQSIKDAIDKGGHGDWVGALGEVLNIVKKKIPAVAFLDACIDAGLNCQVATKVFRVYEKIEKIPADAAKGLIKTLKNKCGGLLNKIEIDKDSSQDFGRILYSPDDAAAFFDDFAKNVTGSLPSNFNPQNGGIGKHFSMPESFKFNFYTNPTSPGEGPTIEILGPNGFKYKFRFKL